MTYHSARRQFLGIAGGTLLTPFIQVKPLAAASSKLESLVFEVTGGAPIQNTGVILELPPVAANGNSVALKVAVASPMTEDDYVQSIHLFAEQNPRPVVARFFLNPRSGRAEIDTRIRLAATQNVVALAALSDGSYRSAGAHVVVTVAACVDGS